MQPKQLVFAFVLATAVSAWRPIGKTRTVRLTQGDIVGMVYESDVPDLGPVEVYRGVPYAQAERFMPPSSPARFDWMDAVKNGPVCPQNLVDLDVGMKMGSGRSASGRLAYLRRLIPFLKNQSEDCLNLNIYVPSQAYLNGLGGNLNVIVFIHGESFSWNSGNPYDGSTLASYGNVIFVTLNYRLGILGFLNTRNNKTTGNFGLLDQIAALRWLKDNIASFGGDPKSITLMGHHTGAIAVNYLMLSPVAQADNGLFQRAILMSGTALSSWAHSKEPEEIAHAVSEHTRCPMYDLLSCLRNKRLQDILSVKGLPEDPAPSVDGIVVKVQPKDLMSHNNDLFTRYDLLCGVTESESHHILDSLALRQGMYNEDIKELLTKFFRENYEHWERSQERAMMVYGLDKPFMSPIEGRDKTLLLLSDARVVAPMVQTAVYHSTPGMDDIRTYFYVFSHRSKHGDHPMASVSVQGEDLAYVLGVPIEGGIHHFPADYSQEEKHLSETMMSLWINFAKTGNPNLPRRKNYLTKGQSDWVLEDVDWPAFEPNNQHYYQIQIPPRIGTKYRDNLMHFWNYFLPTWVPSQSAPNKYTTSTKLEPAKYEDSPKFRFLEMYNPFIPASRTTPLPVAPTEDPLPDSLVTVFIGTMCALFLLLAAATFLVFRYVKMAPCHRGRSLSLPSVEFDVEEILAALEWEKRAGQEREHSAMLDRQIIDCEDDEKVENPTDIPSTSQDPIVKWQKIVPEKPRRKQIWEPSSSQHKLRSRSDPEFRKPRQNTRKSKKNYVGNVSRNNAATTQEEAIVSETRVDEEQIMNQSHESENLPYIGALDKIRKSKFPKVLPDFPFEQLDLEGDITYEKRTASRPPPNLESITRKITPPSPPKVPTIFTTHKERSRNVVPNFLSMHQNIQYSDPVNISGRRQRIESEQQQKSNIKAPKEPTDSYKYRKDSQTSSSLELKKKVKRRKAKPAEKNRAETDRLGNRKTERPSLKDTASTQTNTNDEKSHLATEDKVEDSVNTVEEKYDESKDSERIEKLSSDVKSDQLSIEKPQAIFENENKIIESGSPTDSKNDNFLSDSNEKKDIIDEKISLTSSFNDDDYKVLAGSAEKPTDDTNQQTKHFTITESPTALISSAVIQIDDSSNKANPEIQKKNLLQDIICDFERMSTLSGPSESVNLERKPKPPRLSESKKTFGKILEQILLSQMPGSTQEQVNIENDNKANKRSIDVEISEKELDKEKEINDDENLDIESVTKSDTYNESSKKSGNKSIFIERTVSDEISNSESSHPLSSRTISPVPSEENWSENSKIMTDTPIKKHSLRSHNLLQNEPKSGLEIEKLRDKKPPLDEIPIQSQIFVEKIDINLTSTKNKQILDLKKSSTLKEEDTIKIIKPDRKNSSV